MYLAVQKAALADRRENHNVLNDDDDDDDDVDD